MWLYKFLCSPAYKYWERRGLEMCANLCPNWHSGIEGTNVSVGMSSWKWSAGTIISTLFLWRDCQIKILNYTMSVPVVNSERNFSNLCLYFICFWSSAAAFYLANVVLYSWSDWLLLLIRNLTTIYIILI